MCSIISESPGPEVTVMTFLPAQAAPRMAIDEAISSSIWMNTPPTCGMRCGEPLDHLGRGRDRIAGHEAAAGRERAFTGGVVAVDEVNAGQHSFGIRVQGNLRSTRYGLVGISGSGAAACWPPGP